MTRIRIFLGILLFLAVITAATAAQATGTIATWTKKFPGERYAFFTDQTSDDGFIVVSDIVLNYHTYDWIYRLDKNGDLVWQKILDNGAGAFVARQTPDGGFITAGGMGTMKLDAQGNIEWQKNYRIDSPLYTSQSGIGTIRLTTDGGYIAGGGIVIPGGSFEVFVTKLAENGDVEWLKSFGGLRTEHLGDVEQTSDGGFLLSAYTTSYGSGGSDVWLVKLDSAGNIEWQKTYGLPLSTEYWRLRYGHRVVEAEDGGFVFIASSITQSSSDVWVVKTDRTGEILWQKLYAPMGDSASIERTPDGGYIIGGATRTSDTNNDMLIVKLDGNGDIVWQKKYGKQGAEWFYQVRPTRDGGYYMTGWDWSFSATYWIMKLDETGSIFGCAADLMGEGAATAADTQGTVLVSSTVPLTFTITTETVNGGTATDIYMPGSAVCEETAPDIVVAPDALAFGTVEVSKAAVMTLTVSNRVNKPLTVSSLSLAGADAGMFSQTNTCSTVTGLGNCTVTVTFAPSAVGARTAELAVVSDDPDTPVIVVPLSGTGIDVLPPVTTAIVSGKKENSDWYVSDVNVALNAIDTSSGIREIRYAIDGTEVVVADTAVAFAVSTDGSHGVTYFAVDNAGNKESAHPLTFNIDRTAPVITATVSPMPNADGWNNTDVTITFLCSDALSGVASCPAPVTVSAEGAGQTIMGTATDMAGNTALATVTLNIDKTAPSVSLTADPNILWPPNHKMVPVTINGAVTDSGSEIASVVISVIDEYDKYHMTVPGFGSTIRLEASRKGKDSDGRTYTITAVVMDKSGNRSTATTTVLVPHDRGHDEDHDDDRDHDGDHDADDSHKDGYKDHNEDD